LDAHEAETDWGISFVPDSDEAFSTGMPTPAEKEREIKNTTRLVFAKPDPIRATDDGIRKGAFRK
jgi:hypothetical protein